MKTQILFIIFSLVIVDAKAQFPERYSERIDSLFQKFNSKTPGYSVAVLKDGEVIYKKNFGMADLAENQLPQKPALIWPPFQNNLRQCAYFYWKREESYRWKMI